MSLKSLKKRYFLCILKKMVAQVRKETLIFVVLLLLFVASISTILTINASSKLLPVSEDCPQFSFNNSFSMTSKVSFFFFFCVCLFVQNK